MHTNGHAVSSKEVVSGACQLAIDGESALAALARGPVGLLISDVQMKPMDGHALLARARSEYPDVPVILMTAHGDVPTAVAAVKRGAFDFVEKPFSNNTLVDRVEQALQLSAQALLARRGQDHTARAWSELTEREREVAHLVIEGRPNKLIADELAISVRTVEVHRARVFEKVGVKSAVELANLLRDSPPRP
jgi:two-component system response regulator DctR